jgi:outer membrane lipoprotein-sorting protein
MIRYAATAIVAAGLLAAPSFAQTGESAPRDSAAKPSDAGLPSEAQDLAAVQTYLKNIATLRAKFMQTAPNRAVSSGVMSLEKPGKLRFEYLPPSPILVVSDGKVITLIDYDLKQVTRWPINDTPLRPLVRTDFMFGQDVEVLGIRRNAKQIEVAITDPKKRDEGSMLLTFSRNPLILKQWEVIDERGGSTLIQLEDLQTNIPLDKTLWQWKDPRPKRVGPPTK